MPVIAMERVTPLWRWWVSRAAIREVATAPRRSGTFSGRGHTPRRAFHQTGEREVMNWSSCTSTKPSC